MTLQGLAVLLGGSLGAVLLLVLIARILGLGGGGIWSEEEAIAEAEGIVAGFEGERATIGKDGQAAIVHGRDGAVVLLKQHGSRVAGRQLALPLRCERTSDGLRIETGEQRFGAVLLREVDAV